MELLIATSNKGKIIEITEALRGFNVTIKTPADFGITEQPHEEGDTFEANAMQKARWYLDRKSVV